MNAAETYASALFGVLKQVADTQQEAIQKAADILAKAVVGDGIIYTFGTGHSHIIAEDVAYRAGGLAPVDAILEPSLTGHQHVHKSEYMERVEGMAEVMLNYWGVSPKDALIIISTSGRNAAPIEMAKIAHDRQIPVIAVTSLTYSKGTSSRHSRGWRMYEFADVVIDNLCPKGDCLLKLEGVEQPTGAASGVAGLFILQMLMAQTIENIAKMGVEPPVLRAGNLDGSDEWNKKMLDRYHGRIKVW
jgi:uncharacterized phosphosugar-binding protein